MKIDRNVPGATDGEAPSSGRIASTDTTPLQFPSATGSRTVSAASLSRLAQRLQAGASASSSSASTPTPGAARAAVPPDSRERGQKRALEPGPAGLPDFTTAKRQRSDRPRPAGQLPRLATPRATTAAGPGTSASGSTSASAQTRGPAPATGISATSLARPTRGNTAESIYRILVELSRGRSRAEIIKRCNAAPSKVDSWIYAKTWESRNLKERLAKMPDYASYRDKLAALNEQHPLGLWTGELLPAGRTARAVEAGDLLAVLELRAAGRTVRNAIDTVAERAGLDAGELGDWFTPTGDLAKRVEAASQLHGYQGVRGDLQRRLTEQNHAATAASLPDRPTCATGPLTTRDLVDILTTLARDKTASLSAIGRACGIDRTRVLEYVVPGSGLLRNPSAVQKWPDYGAHRDALEAALRALGHDQQADGLTRQTQDAQQFMQVLRDKAPRLAEAVRAMRTDSTLSTDEAASRAGVAPSILSIVAQAGGEIRERAEVAAQLKGMKPWLGKGLDDQLAHLRGLVTGAPAAASGSTMKAVEFRRYGNVPAKVFVVERTSFDPGPDTANRVKNLYAGSPNLVREPRSYANEPDRQVLRWLATALKHKFGGYEVQCYFDASRGDIVVSSNSNRINREIREFVRNGRLGSLFARGEVPPNTIGAERLRHLEQLKAALSDARRGSAAAGRSDAPQSGLAERQRRRQDILTALWAGRISVPSENVRANGQTIDLHAERRIKAVVEQRSGQRVDSEVLAGTMRPCGTCADDLGLEETARRGPFWKSQAADPFNDTPRLVEQNVRQSIGTYVTKTRTGKYTLDHDTDSEPETEATPSRREVASRVNEGAAPGTEPSIPEWGGHGPRAPRRAR